MNGGPAAEKPGIGRKLNDAAGLCPALGVPAAIAYGCRSYEGAFGLLTLPMIRCVDSWIHPPPSPSLSITG
jgi:hypothetical protein